MHKGFKVGRTCGPWAVQNRWGAQSGKTGVSLRKIKVLADPGGRSGPPKEGAETPRDQLFIDLGPISDGVGFKFVPNSEFIHMFFHGSRNPKKQQT